MCGKGRRNVIRNELYWQTAKGRLTKAIKKRIASEKEISVSIVINKPHVIVRIEDSRWKLEAWGVATWSGEDQTTAARLEQALTGLANAPKSDNLGLELLRGDLLSVMDDKLAEIEWDTDKGISLAVGRSIRHLRDQRLGLVEVVCS